MAVGNVVYNGSKKTIQVLSVVTGDTAAPALATDGVAVHGGSVDAGIANTRGAASFHNRFSGDYILNLSTTNGTSPQVNINMWGYQAVSGLWYIVQTDTAIGTAPNQSNIRHQIEYRNLGVYDRVYVQVAGTQGTLGTGGQGLSAWLSCQPES